VAELFMVMPLDSPLDSVSGPDAAPTTDEFFAWPKARQAEFVFDQLFIKRTPISEACRGVITVLQKLGLGKQLREARAAPPPRRLDGLRAWFAEQDPMAYVEKVFALAGIRYAVMTNIPFSAEEAEHWMPDPQTGAVPPVPSCLKPALRVDPLLAGAARRPHLSPASATPRHQPSPAPTTFFLPCPQPATAPAGDWPGVSATLARCEPPYPQTLAGCRRFLVDWVRRMKPIYLMASTPHGFSLPPTSASASSSSSSAAAAEAGAEEGGAGAAPPSRAQLLEEVLLAVAQEESLPIAIKVGAVRGAVRGRTRPSPARPSSSVRRRGPDARGRARLTPALACRAAEPRAAHGRRRGGGGGPELGAPAVRALPGGQVPAHRALQRQPARAVRARAQVRQPARVRLLVVLRRPPPRPHTAPGGVPCPTGACGSSRRQNNPSIIEATTRMRLEMLGTAFTCQHSDARVLDQLLYKWPHSREVVWPVLAEQYAKLVRSGWDVCEDDVRRDVALLFGGAFEAFMEK
jgi:hypothetical protein